MIAGRLLDHAYSVVVDDEDLAGRVTALLRDSRDDARGGAPLRLRRLDGGELSLTAPGAPEIRSTNEPWVLGMLCWRLNQGAREASAGSLLLHAGAVALDAARVILVAGDARSGKSTVTTALALSGLAYLTDDLVAIGAAGDEVTGSNKPISLRAPSVPLLGLDPARLRGTAGAEVSSNGDVVVAPGALGLAVVRSGRPVAVVFPTTNRDPGSLRRLTPGEGLLRLHEHCLNQREHGADGFRTLARLARGVAAYEWGRGQLDGLADLAAGLAGPVRAQSGGHSQIFHLG